MVDHEQYPLTVVQGKSAGNSLKYPAIPPNVHLMTSTIYNSSTILVRFQHLYAVGEHSKYSKPVNVRI